MEKRITVYCGLLAGLLLPILVLAQEFTGSSFQDANPVLTIEGGYSSSSNFQLFGGSGQTVVGESTSTSFITRSGFFYFPLVSSPVLIGTAGNAEAALTWTAAIGFLGFNVSSYDIGQATASNGPFAYSAVGNILSSTRVGLTNNQTYYFVVRARDAFGNPIASSSVVLVTPVGVVIPPVTPPSPAAPSPGIPISNALLQLEGATAPGSTVFVLRNGVLIGSFLANPAGTFSSLISSLQPGQAVFSLFARDIDGFQSAAVTLLIALKAEETTVVSGIIIPPIIRADKTGAAVGEPINFTGSAPPSSDVLIYGADGKLIGRTRSDSSGNFSFTVDSRALPDGEHIYRARVQKNNQTSELSRPIVVTVGKKVAPSVNPETPKGCTIADFNCDGRVDLVDFSILLYWFERTRPPAGIDLNTDNRVDILDFSILMYYWTG